MATQGVINRDLLDEKMVNGDIVYKYPFYTYGCISEGGIAVCNFPPVSTDGFVDIKKTGPFFEVPADAVDWDWNQPKKGCVVVENDFDARYNMERRSIVIYPIEYPVNYNPLDRYTFPPLGPGGWGIIQEATKVVFVTSNGQATVIKDRCSTEPTPYFIGDFFLNFEASKEAVRNG